MHHAKSGWNPSDSRSKKSNFHPFILSRLEVHKLGPGRYRIVGGPGRTLIGWDELLVKLQNLDVWQPWDHDISWQCSQFPRLIVSGKDVESNSWTNFSRRKDVKCNCEPKDRAARSSLDTGRLKCYVNWPLMAVRPVNVFAVILVSLFGTITVRTIYHKRWLFFTGIKLHCRLSPQKPSSWCRGKTVELGRRIQRWGSLASRGVLVRQ